MLSSQLTGPSSLETVYRITLKGNSYQRGKQLGTAIAKYLEDFYWWFVQKPAQDILTVDYKKTLEAIEEKLSAVFPQFLEYIKGVSDGSHISIDMVRLMNFHNDIRSLLPRGCSNGVITHGPDGPWLAKTDDLPQSLSKGYSEHSWQILCTSYCDDCYDHIGPSYVGAGGDAAAGLNSAGLAVGGSSLWTITPEQPKLGIANASNYMLCLCDSAGACCEAALNYGFCGKGANFPVLDSSCAAAVIETGAALTYIRKPDNTGFIAATNHSASGSIPPNPEISSDLIENDMVRYTRLTDLIAACPQQERTVELACRSVSDHKNLEAYNSLCQHNPEGYKTVFAFIARPIAKEFIFFWGNPCQSSPETIKLGHEE